MNKQDFTNSVLDLVSKSLTEAGNDISVECKDITKNNDMVLTGLIIKNADSNVAPTIYLDSYYSRFSDGLLSIDDVSESIIETYLMNKKDSIRIDFIQDFSKVRDSIIPCICNTALNEDFLKEHPSTPFLDLSIYYRVLVSDDVMKQADGEATIAVTNQLADIWNTTADELFTLAFHNAKSISPASFKTMGEIMSEMVSDISEFPDDIFESNPMYVLSNSNKSNGAVWMADEEVLKTIATQLDDDFYLICSSRHENILIPSSFTSDEQNLKDMIKEVNDTQVAEEDLLSYSLYRFYRATNELKIA